MNMIERMDYEIIWHIESQIDHPAERIGLTMLAWIGLYVGEACKYQPRSA